jgi:hypothetical protein
MSVNVAGKKKRNHEMLELLSLCIFMTRKHFFPCVNLPEFQKQREGTRVVFVDLFAIKWKSLVILFFFVKTSQESCA